MQDGVSRGDVPVSVAVLPGLAAAGVAAVAIFATNRREALRLEHERQLKREELEDQRQRRLREERREAYTAYMAACDRLHDGDYLHEAMAEFTKTIAVVWLVSSSEAVREAAHGLSN